MNEKIRDAFIFVVTAAVFLAIAFAVWKIERWINWKFDYSKRVSESRIVMDPTRGAYFIYIEKADIPTNESVLAPANGIGRWIKIKPE